MIDASIVRRMQKTKADELHRKLCDKIEQAVINAAMDSFTAIIVQSHNAMYLVPDSNTPSIRLEAYAYDIERLQFVLKMAGYEVESPAGTNSFIIKW